MLLKSQILDAQSKSKSAFACARYLKVSYPTYKKWAKYHEVFENLINPNGFGVRRPKTKQVAKNLLAYISGEKIHTVPRTYMNQLIKHHYKDDRCESCGFDNSRDDGKKPFLINFIDGVKKNTRLENIEILCYNCYYINVGGELIANRRRKYWTPSYFNTASNVNISKYDDESMKWSDIDMESVPEDNLQTPDDRDVDDLFNKLNN